MAVYSKKSPTRIDLAGGTLDLWPLYVFLGGAKTVNLAIDIWTEAALSPREDQRIILESPDLHLKKEFSSLKELLQTSDSKLALFQRALEAINPNQGFHLKTSSQCPIGSGLGGSSSLMMSLLDVFEQWQGKRTPLLDTVRLASHIEAQILWALPGTQDYFPPACGGLNIIDYSLKETQYQTLNTDLKVFKDHLLVVDTGRSHHSGLNNWEVVKSVVAKEEKIIDALKELKNVAEVMAEAAEGAKWSQLPSLFEREYRARIQLTPAFSSPEIEKLKEISSKNGGAIKICGAGGGGCVAIWCDDKKQMREECQNEKFQVLEVEVVPPLS